MYFCERCMGIKQDIWLNGDVQCGHIGEVIIEQQHFKYLVDNKLLTKVNMEAKE